VEELHEDIDETLRTKLPSKQRLEMIISKENLRRILKNNHEIRLQSHTRNCLAYYLGFEGWEDFKENVKLIIPQEPVQVNYVQVYQSLLPLRQTNYPALPHNTDYVILPNESFWKTKLFKQIITGILGIILLSLSGFSSYQWYKNRPFTTEQLAQVKFEIIEDYPKPNTNHFKIRYDVSSLNCDSVVIDYDGDQIYMIDFQQNGGTYQEVFKNKIDTISHTYFEPNIFEIKLIVRNQVIRTIKKIVYTGNQWTGLANGRYSDRAWQGHIKTQSEIINNGILHLPPNLIDRPNANLGFWTRFQIIQDFAIDVDSLMFETRIKNNYEEGGISCFDSSIGLITENKVGIGGNFLQDCIEYAGIQIGKINLNGTNQNMSFMDVNLQDWKVVKIKLHNHIAYFYVNDKEIFHTKYEGDFVQLKELKFNFKGSGSVDWVKLSNSYTGKVVFYDDFLRGK
jgi:hypothetical protein